MVAWRSKQSHFKDNGIKCDNELCISLCYERFFYKNVFDGENVHNKMYV